MNSVFIRLLASYCLLVCIVQVTCAQKPWNNHPQPIPGRVEAEYYDLGGEGVAYHDSDNANSGSGKLNPVNGNPLNEFRITESADISYTKPTGIDENPFNRVSPVMKSVYLGWTMPGEWVKYTVDVARTSTYSIGLMYTANGNGAISIDVDGKPQGAKIDILSTHDDRDTVAWRQWHHWNKANHLAFIDLVKGTHVITIHIVENGNMNLDYLDFELQARSFVRFQHWGDTDKPYGVVVFFREGQSDTAIDKEDRDWKIEVPGTLFDSICNLIAFRQAAGSGERMSEGNIYGFAIRRNGETLIIETPYFNRIDSVFNGVTALVGSREPRLRSYFPDLLQRLRSERHD